MAGACGLSSCGVWALLFQGTWDLPRPGTEPVSPALASRFSTTLVKYNLAILNLVASTFCVLTSKLYFVYVSWLLRYTVHLRFLCMVSEKCQGSFFSPCCCC